jgi:hypothetical protein
MEAPNSKHQITNKLQLPKFETKSFWPFEIGIWSLFGIWNLRFGILDTLRYANSGGVNGSARDEGKRARSYFYHGEAI